MRQFICKDGKIQHAINSIKSLWRVRDLDKVVVRIVYRGKDGYKIAVDNQNWCSIDLICYLKALENIGFSFSEKNRNYNNEIRYILEKESTNDEFVEKYWITLRLDFYL